MSNGARAALINNDPIVCCLYFDKLVHTIMIALKRKSGPFGKYTVKDYFLRANSSIEVVHTVICYYGLKMLQRLMKVTL